MAEEKRNNKSNAAKNKVVVMPRKDGDRTEDAASKKKAELAKPKTHRGTTDKNSENPAETIEEDEYKGAKKRLRKWVKKVVKSHSPKIAETLVEQTEAGNTQSAAMVLSLMEKKKKGGGDGDEDEPSLSDQLMAGPTWEEVLEARRAAKEEEEKAGAA
jgi:hypothetical protein